MSRKLKRKTKVAVSDEPKKPRKLRKWYVKQKCAFANSEGIKCNMNAVGKSTLCGKHGGERIDRDNLITGKSNLPVSSVFDASKHPINYIDLSRSGMSNVEIAAEFMISTATLKDWSEKYVEFSTAYEIGQALHESWWLQQGKGGLHDNRNFNTSLFKFLTGNKLGYSDKIESKNLNINAHGVLLVPDAMSESAWSKANMEDVIDADIE